MATTITAAPDTATGSVTLTVAHDVSVSRVLRSNAYGLQEVRAASGQLPSAATGTTILTDYEAGHGVNQYLVYNASGVQVASTTATLSVDAPWLTVPIAPNYSEQVQMITNYSAGRSTNSFVHQIIGRADPIVSMGKLGTRTGTLEMHAETLESAERLARVFSRGEAVYLKQQVQGMDMYFIPEDIDVSPYTVAGQDATEYRFAVSYREVSRPFGGLAGALGWTFDALASAYPSFDAVTAAYADFDALTLGDTL